MNILTLFKDMGFKIPWKLVSIGLYGHDEIPVSLTYDDVFEYLYSLLNYVDEHTNDAVALFCQKDDLLKFDILLKELAHKDGSDVSIQKRKWIVALLKKTLDNISSDCLQGMLELMDFWITMLDTPDYCPQAFPTNYADVQAYFTETSYHYVLDKNVEWLNNETLKILKLEN